MNTPWLYDETAQVGTDYGSPAEVAAYDRRMQTLRDVAAETQAVAAALAVTNESIVWEIGTGTGECALGLAAHAGKVYATDVSPAMLDCARQKAVQRHVGNVTFERGGFLSGFRPPAPLDGVVTQLALHHLPDFWKMQALSAIAERLRPGGRLYLRDVVFPEAARNADAYFKAAVENVRSHAGDEVARQTIQHIKAEFSTLDWILEGMIARSGLRLVEKVDSGFLSVYVCERGAANGA